MATSTCRVAPRLPQRAQRHFSRIDGLVLAAVDLSVLGDTVRWEPSRGGQLFPHIYGLLPVGAVVSTATLSEPLMGQSSCPLRVPDAMPKINIANTATDSPSLGVSAPVICSDIDMISSNADGRFAHNNGVPYPRPLQVLPWVADRQREWPFIDFNQPDGDRTVDQAPILSAGSASKNTCSARSDCSRALQCSSPCQRHSRSRSDTPEWRSQSAQHRVDGIPVIQPVMGVLRPGDLLLVQRGGDAAPMPR